MFPTSVNIVQLSNYFTQTFHMMQTIHTMMHHCSHPINIVAQCCKRLFNLPQNLLFTPCDVIVRFSSSQISARGPLEGPKQSLVAVCIVIPFYYNHTILFRCHCWSTVLCKWGSNINCDHQHCIVTKMTWYQNGLWYTGMKFNLC